MTISYTAKKTKYGQPEVSQSHIENFEARIALGLLNAHGMILGTQNGEDSTGRAKPGSLPPAETVQRAFDIAELAVAEMVKRNWLIPIED